MIAYYILLQITILARVVCVRECKIGSSFSKSFSPNAKTRQGHERFIELQRVISDFIQPRLTL